MVHTIPNFCSPKCVYVYCASVTCSSTYDPEQGLDEYTDEVYENQTRQFFSNWPEAKNCIWTDFVSLVGMNVSMYI